MLKRKIISRLQALEELHEVSVNVSGSANGTIRISHKRHHGPEFIFRWHVNHFVGYFVDGDGKQSQAVVSIYTPMAAIQFVSAYVMLNEIRANQRG